MNISLSLHSWFFRVYVLLIGLFIGATFGQITLIASVLKDHAELRPLLTTIWGGIVCINTIICVCVCVVVWQMHRRAFTRPLRRITRRIEAMQLPQTGDVTMSADTAWSHDIRHLARVTSLMFSRLNTMLITVHETSQQIVESCQKVSRFSQNQSALLNSQGSTSENMADTIRELVTTVQHIRDDVKSVVTLANKTLQLAEIGQQAVMNVAKSMEDIRHSSHVSADKILALGKQSEHVNDVVKTIDRIIDDTKLIAFNATIEAARAKDEGRGFGIVASEIRRLAEEVFESTEDIKELIHEIQEASHALILATEQERNTVQRGAKLAEEAGTSLRQIFQMVKLTTESAQRIASTTEQQTGANEQVLHVVEAVKHSTERFAQESQQLTDTTGHIQELAEKLRTIMTECGLKRQG